MVRPQSDDELIRPRRRRATSVEQRERQLIALAYDRAEEQLRNGTASAQVISQLLKSGSSQMAEERAKLQNENALLKARVESLASQARVEELYANALNAMRAYSGQIDNEDEDEN